MQTDEEKAIIRLAANSGYPLDQAWIIFSDENDQEDLERAKVADDETSRSSVKTARHNLLKRLRKSELIAVGVTHLNLTSPHWARARPEMCREGNVDWSGGKIIDGEKRLARVQVSKNVGDVGALFTFKEVAKNYTDVDNVSANSKIGRPRVIEKIRAIVKELKVDPSRPLEGKLVKEQEAYIREIARELHPRDFPRTTTPSRSKILEALSLEYPPQG